MRKLLLALCVAVGGSAAKSANQEMATEPALVITEIMPKPTDAQNRGTLEGMDPNGLESGWVELENTSDRWVDLKDYKFIRTNRSKANSKGDFGNFPSVAIAPYSRFVFYTSERYATSADMSVSAFEVPVNAERPMVYARNGEEMLVWPDKVNPKKFAFVRLYYAPEGAGNAL